jgi:hypothetical protein
VTPVYVPLLWFFSCLEQSPFFPYADTYAVHL